jgi:uncharacterized membrane protein HdeD (DUF308 family)
VAFGIALKVRPEAGALAVLWLIGSYAILFGTLIVVFAFKIRSFVRKFA